MPAEDSCWYRKVSILVPVLSTEEIFSDKTYDSGRTGTYNDLLVENLSEKSEEARNWRWKNLFRS